jgi:pimeloyl-ACP methyl ester carboxylesterase
MPTVTAGQDIMTGTGNPSPPVDHVLVRGRRLALRVQGEGEPAVMVHGLGGTSTNWTDLMHALPLHCVAIDLPGFGYSDPIAGRASIEVFAEDVAACIGQLFPGQRVHVFGNSLGAAVVLDLCALHPDLVRSVTLISPAMPQYLPRRSNYQVPIVAVPVIGPRLFRKWQRFTAEQRMWGTVRVVYGDPSAVDPARFAEMVAETLRRDADPATSTIYIDAVRALLRTYVRIGRRSLWRCLGAITVPLLVIHGRRDILVDSRQAHQVSRVRPGGVIALIMRTAHVSQMEAPLEVARLWREHIG